MPTFDLIRILVLQSTLKVFPSLLMLILLPEVNSYVIKQGLGFIMSPPPPCHSLALGFIQALFASFLTLKLVHFIWLSLMCQDHASIRLLRILSNAGIPSFKEADHLACC